MECLKVYITSSGINFVEHKLHNHWLYSFLLEPNLQNPCELLDPKQSEFDCSLLCWIFLHDLDQYSCMTLCLRVQRAITPALLLLVSWSTALQLCCVWDQCHWNSLLPQVLWVKGLSLPQTDTLLLWVDISALKLLEQSVTEALEVKVSQLFTLTHLFCAWTRIPGLSITCLLKNHKLFSTFKVVWKDTSNRLSFQFPQLKHCYPRCVLWYHPHRNGKPITVNYHIPRKQALDLYQRQCNRPLKEYAKMV